MHIFIHMFFFVLLLKLYPTLNGKRQRHNTPQQRQQHHNCNAMKDLSTRTICNNIHDPRIQHACVQPRRQAKQKTKVYTQHACVQPQSATTFSYTCIPKGTRHTQHTHSMICVCICICMCVRVCVCVCVQIQARHLQVEKHAYP